MNNGKRFSEHDNFHYHKWCNFMWFKKKEDASVLFLHLITMKLNIKLKNSIKFWLKLQVFQVSVEKEKSYLHFHVLFQWNCIILFTFIDECKRVTIEQNILQTCSNISYCWLSYPSTNVSTQFLVCCLDILSSVDSK